MYKFRFFNALKAKGCLKKNQTLHNIVNICTNFQDIFMKIRENVLKESTKLFQNRI